MELIIHSKIQCVCIYIWLYMCVCIYAHTYIYYTYMQTTVLIWKFYLTHYIIKKQWYFLIGTMIINQCDLITQAFWLSCLVMYPLEAFMSTANLFTGKHLTPAWASISGTFAVRGSTLAGGSPHTPWSAVSSQLVGAMEPNSDQQKNLMASWLFCWSEWINSLSCIFGDVNWQEW